MSKILAYFVGGSHDLEKRWIEERLHNIEMPELMSDKPHVVGYDHNGQPAEVLCKIERYVRVARLRGQRNAFVYECVNE